MSVRESLELDLNRRDPALISTTLGQAALALAISIDRVTVGEVAHARDLAPISKEFRATVAELLATAPEVKAGDAVDDLNARRKARRDAAG